MTSLLRWFVLQLIKNVYNELRLFIYNTGTTLPKLRLPWLRFSLEVFTYILERFATKVFLSTILPFLHWITCRSGIFSLFLNCSTNSTFGKGPTSAWMVRLLFGLLSPVKGTLPEEGDQGASICSLVLIMHYGLLALLFILSESAGEVHNLFCLSY